MDFPTPADLEELRNPRLRPTSVLATKRKKPSGKSNNTGPKEVEMEGGRLEGGLEKRARLGSRLSCMCERVQETNETVASEPEA